MVHRGILNTSLVEVNYKVLSRCYLVPARLARLHPGISPLCFRGCGREGTMFHVWWTHPKVQRFWIRIFTLVYSIQWQDKIYLKKNPKTALFADLLNKIPWNLRTLIFLAAKFTIARARTSPLVNVALVKHNVSWITVNEKLTIILRDKQARFEKVWPPGLNTFKPHSSQN